MLFHKELINTGLINNKTEYEILVYSHTTYTSDVIPGYITAKTTTLLYDTRAAKYFAHEPNHTRAEHGYETQKRFNARR